MDTLTTRERSRRMALIKSRDSGPERWVRSMLHAAGHRYRLHDRSLPGTPDLVFASRGKVIFVHGCFWHRHNRCALARLPKSRQAFWYPKLEGNRLRDRAQRRRLSAMGWGSLVVWECELANPVDVMLKMLRFLEE
jgi:DNA mismatch endonuclease (patch repair protein)